MNRIFLLLTFYALLFSSCDKDKEDISSYNPLEEIALSNSRTIVFNQYFEQVVANGKVVTNVINSFNGSKYFPERGMYGGVWKAAVWQIPQEIFEDNEINFYMNGPDATVNFTVQEDNGAYYDHYIIPRRGDVLPEVVTVTREVSAPAKPDHFKIRVLNLTRQVTSAGSDQIAGPLTLAYADGTPVSPLTTDVPVSDKGSEYIELPYGTYQFKVLTPEGIQVSGDNIDGNETGDNPTIGVEYSTGRLVADQGSPLLTYAQIKTYQPGGVYTIVVMPRQINGMNRFVRIVDNIVPLNESYGRVHAVNALPGQTATFRVNGETLASNLAYASASDYTITPAGAYTVEALDASGKVLASAESTLDAEGNVSAWLFPNAAGGAELRLVVNDLSGLAYRAVNADDALNNRWEFDMPLSFRFLNLSPDFANVSLTLDEGASILDYYPHLESRYRYPYSKNPDAFYNLRPGEVPMRFPYAYFTFHSTLPFNLLTFRSDGHSTPGLWADDVPVFASEEFVANPDLYNRINRTVPTYEPGYYTLALIGRNGDKVPAAEKARILCIKHNK